MKKLLAIALTSILLIGCSSNTSASTPTNTPADTPSDTSANTPTNTPTDTPSDTSANTSTEPVTKTCSYPDISGTYILNGTEDTLESFAYSSIVDVSNQDKELQQQAAQTFALPYQYMDGVEYDYTIENGVIKYTIEADINTISNNDLQLITLNDKINLDSDMKASIKSLEANGYTCK